MNWIAIHQAAKLAQAAYSETLAGAVLAFRSMGYTMRGHYINDSHQAFLLTRDSDNSVTLAISGTRFGRSIGDLFADADIGPTDLGNGLRVASGPYKGMDAMWVWARSLVPADTKWTVLGHSLGGERALLTELFIPASDIMAVYAFEAPKCGSCALWTKVAASLSKATCVINGSDLWSDWPMVSEWSHPPIMHIHTTNVGKGWTMVGPGSWPAGLNPDDHSIAMVVDRLGKIAGVVPVQAPA